MTCALRHGDRKCPGSTWSVVNSSGDVVGRARGTAPRYGAKVRALRRRESLNQVQLAEKLGISPSYLNLIENNRRPLPANLLIRLAQLFNVDVNSFATDEDTRLVADLTEAFAIRCSRSGDLTSVDVREMAAASPVAARAVLSLYRAYQAGALQRGRPLRRASPTARR